MQWEYLTVRRDDDTKTLNDYGRDGWELVSQYEGWTKYGTKGSFATFKRPLPQSAGEMLTDCKQRQNVVTSKTGQLVSNPSSTGDW